MTVDPDIIKLDSVVNEDGETRTCEYPLADDTLCNKPAQYLLEPVAENPFGTFLCHDHAWRVAGAGF